MPAPSRARWSSLLSALVVLLTLAVSGCAEEAEGEGLSGVDCKEGSTLTWESFGQKFMTDYCTRCHASSLTGVARNGAPSDHNLETVLLVRQEIDHVYEEAAAGPDGVNTAMPIGAPKPTEAERQMLGEWLACGAP